MIYAVMQQQGETLPSLYTFRDWTTYRDALRMERNGNRRKVKVFSAMSTEISRKDYQSEKAQAYSVLVQMQELLSIPGLSMGEMQHISDHAERIARRYGQLQEARENGIC